MPFFITWDIPDELYPGHQRAAHRVQPRGLSWVELAGDKDRLREWLGDAELPIRVADGNPGIRRVAIATSDGELVID